MYLGTFTLWVRKDLSTLSHGKPCEGTIRQQTMTFSKYLEGVCSFYPESPVWLDKRMHLKSHQGSLDNMRSIPCLRCVGLFGCQHYREDGA